MRNWWGKYLDGIIILPRLGVILMLCVDTPTSPPQVVVWKEINFILPPQHYGLIPRILLMTAYIRCRNFQGMMRMDLH